MRNGAHCRRQHRAVAGWRYSSHNEPNASKGRSPGCRISTCFEGPAGDSFTGKAQDGGIHLGESHSNPVMSMTEVSATRPPRAIRSPADYAAAGRREQERRARQYARARERQAAQGEVRLTRWVPAAHTALIRDLVGKASAALAKGIPSEEILSYAAWPAHLPAWDRAALEAYLDPAAAHALDDDPSHWRGAGLKARRRAQNRRRAARQKALGLAQASFTIPESFRSEIAPLLELIIIAIGDGMLPVIVSGDPEEVSAAAKSASGRKVPAGERCMPRPLPPDNQPQDEPGRGRGADAADSPAAAHEGSADVMRDGGACGEQPGPGAVGSDDPPIREPGPLIQGLSGGGTESSILFEDIHAVMRFFERQGKAAGPGGSVAAYQASRDPRPPRTEASDSPSG